ncbi:hypothetical protein BM1_04300 [Bipolaris maydis]|nr:hypothetical protein BM1_04300 [Bipolaris maydis]
MAPLAATFTDNHWSPSTRTLANAVHPHRGDSQASWQSGSRASRPSTFGDAHSRNRITFLFPSRRSPPRQNQGLDQPNHGPLGGGAPSRHACTIACSRMQHRAVTFASGSVGTGSSPDTKKGNCTTTLLAHWQHTKRAQRE